MSTLSPDNDKVLIDAFDYFLPRYNFSERHAITIHGQPSDILDTIADYRVQDDPLIRQVISLRELPGRLSKHLSAPPLDLDDFTLLARTEHTLAYGLAGAFWRADYGLCSLPSADAFIATKQGDICKLVLGFTVAPISRSRCRLITKTRVLCLSDKARRYFTPYWFLIRPVSGLLRRRMLWNIRRIIEQN
ncbi:hypothetical protein LU298_12865 [Komagataeibacter intermedius]|nr:hypothetical protein [Komagataeibacter intermedius]MCF3637384.1 hypothetical protein [Komagataeibacter intermedius]